MEARKALFARFPNRARLFFPVIHLIPPEQGKTAEGHLHEQVGIAVKAGADGVFLCPATAGMTAAEVMDALRFIREQFSELFVGVNFLGPVPAECQADAIWTDFGVTTKGIEPRALELAKTFAEDQEKEEKKENDKTRGVLRFTGWLFKGKPRDLPEKDEERRQMVNTAAQQLKELGPLAVCCTSGPATGIALEEERRELFRATLGPDAVIAVASGVTVENLPELLPYVDVYLVATGVEMDLSDPVKREFYKSAGIPGAEVGYLDPAKVEAVAKCIRTQCRSRLIS